MDIIKNTPDLTEDTNYRAQVGMTAHHMSKLHGRFDAFAGALAETDHRIIRVSIENPRLGLELLQQIMMIVDKAIVLQENLKNHKP